MTEPRRLMNSAADDFELALLRSAQTDEPRQRSLLDTAAALGIPAGVMLGAATSTTSAAAAGAASTGAASAAAGAAKITTTVLFKYFGVGIAAGLMTVGALQLSNGPAGQPSAATPAQPAVSQVPVAARQPVLAPGFAAEVPPPPPEEALPATADVSAAAPVVAGAKASRAELIAPSAMPNPPSELPAAEAPAEPKAVAAFDLPAEPAPAVPSSKPAEAAPSILGEVASLDKARRALAQRNGAAALEVLDEYTKSSPTRVLQTEAAVLRIEALMQTGQREQAAALARQFIAAHPGSRHAARLQALIGSP